MPDGGRKKQAMKTAKLLLRAGGFFLDTRGTQSSQSPSGGAGPCARSAPSRPPIGGTASVAAPIGGLCLTGLYEPAPRPSLRLSSGGREAAGAGARAGPGWATRGDSGETDGNTPCETLINPQPEASKFQAGRPQIPSP